MPPAPKNVVKQQMNPAPPSSGNKTADKAASLAPKAADKRAILAPKAANKAASAPADPHNWAGIAASMAGGATEGGALASIMAQSGSTDPSDPYNWKGIAAALAAQGQPSNYDAPSTYTPPPAAAAPAPMVMETPSSITSQSIQAPSSITQTSTGVAGAPEGTTFQSIGRGGTFGMFDRMRNQRSPRTGLSVTPEMLRRAAQARLGSM